MIRAHRIRLHPTTEQAIYFAKSAGTARFAYNWGLEQWTQQYAEYIAGKRDKPPNARNYVLNSTRSGRSSSPGRMR